MIIKLITFSFVIVFSHILTAQTLILPESDVDFKTYRSTCEKVSYYCTDKFFINLYAEKETPQFEELINSIDLSSKVFVQSFTKKITQVLQNEMLSVEQLEMSLKLIAQVSEAVENKNQLSLIESDLKQIKDSLTNAKQLPVSENFYLFFKKPISESDLKSLRTLVLKYPLVKTYFNSVPQLASVRSLRFNSVNEPLLNGHCETAQMNPQILVTAWQPLANSACTFSEQVSNVSSTVTSSVNKNRGWLLTGAIVVGAAILLNQYEVQFTF
jgi:hypothetical protein